jgi:hypothetical protein
MSKNKINFKINVSINLKLLLILNVSWETGHKTQVNFQF